MHTIAVYLVDAFTAVPFKGNPASVCLLDREGQMDDTTMQAIAAEMNHSETAFVQPLDGTADRATRFALRWFTPQVEVPLCGHATLASAAEVFREAHNREESISFETLSGTLTSRRQGSAIVLDFPVADAEPAPEARTPSLALSSRRQGTAAATSCRATSRRGSASTKIR